MNEDKFAGEGRDITGKAKETAGDMTGNTSLQGEGLGDQRAGKAQKIVGAARDAISPYGEPLADRARRALTDFSQETRHDVQQGHGHAVQSNSRAAEQPSSLFQKEV